MTIAERVDDIMSAITNTLDGYRGEIFRTPDGGVSFEMFCGDVVICDVSVTPVVTTISMHHADDRLYALLGVCVMHQCICICDSDIIYQPR